MDIHKKYTKAELYAVMGRIASTVKLVCGVANNAALLVVLDAHDKVRRHPAYRHKVKHLYQQAIQVYREQERSLLYAQKNRMFHLADMTDDVRKKYGDITDVQYFEFWQGLGARAYTEGRPWLTSLQNKYRLSLLGHGIDNADTLAWAMTAQACLELACTMYENYIRQASDDHKLPESLLRSVFGLFSMRRTADLWHRALDMTDPQSTRYDLAPLEERNITLGIQQLHEAWSDPRLIYGSAFTATEDFGDLFRTRGENKKALREINEVMELSEEELQQMKLNNYANEQRK